MLCGGPAIHLFSATELERLVCGNPLLDFAALQANSRYDGGYSAEHRVRLYRMLRIPDLSAVVKDLLHSLRGTCTVYIQGQMHAGRLFLRQLIVVGRGWKAADLLNEVGISETTPAFNLVQALIRCLVCAGCAGREVAVGDSGRVGRRGEAPLPQILHRLRPGAHWRPRQPQASSPHAISACASGCSAVLTPPHIQVNFPG